jgi:hypothetical protein
MSVVKAAFLVVAVIVVLLLVKQKLSSGSFIGGGSSELVDAQHGLTPVSVGVSGVANGGVNLSSGSATFKDVKYGGQAKASATRTFGAGSYSLSVSATLPNPSGDKYQVWLVNGDQIKDAGFVSGSGSSWSLVFNDSKNYSSYNTIWITREITTEDEKPEQHVLEGSF